MVKHILPLFPKHKVYVEVFGGGASLLFAKIPSPMEVYNDIDSGLVNFFRVLRNKDKFEEFHRLVSLMPYSREEYYSCRRTWAEQENEIERAAMWFVASRQSFSGEFGGSWSHSVGHMGKGMSMAVSRYLSAIDLLPQAHERLMRVQIEHCDFRKILTKYDSPDTLFYLDPPYVHSTRRSGKYVHEMTDADHNELIQMCLQLTGQAILSGYDSSLYLPLEVARWKRHDVEVSCSAAGRTRGTGLQGEGSCQATQRRVESVWVSPLATTQQ